MNDHESPTTSSTTGTGLKRRVAIATLGLATALGVVNTAPWSAEASTTGSTCVASSTTTDYTSAINRAKAAMSKALVDIGFGHYAKATQHLTVLKRNALLANSVATGLIGKPPTDPESDDVPGVAAVLKAGALDHKITVTLVPLFGDPRGQHVEAPLGKALKKADTCRDAMLDTVIALRPGARDDYVDGLSDTLPAYQQELTALTTALAGNELTVSGRAVLQRASNVVSATSAAMESVFGGGERSTGWPR